MGSSSTTAPRSSLLRRLRLADDEPVAIEEAVFAADLGAVLLEADLEQGSLFQTLRQRRPSAHGRPRQSLRGCGDAPPTPVSSASKGGPLLVERRVIFDQTGRPLEFTESRYAATAMPST